jgi:hypothetical protein
MLMRKGWRLGRSEEGAQEQAAAGTPGGLGGSPGGAAAGAPAALLAGSPGPAPVVTLGTGAASARALASGPVSEPARTTVPGPAAEPADAAVPEKIDIPELLRLQAAGERMVILDVRTDRALEGSDHTALGAIRLHPERPVQEAERLTLPREAWLVAFCA